MGRTIIPRQVGLCRREKLAEHEPGSEREMRQQVLGLGSAFRFLPRFPSMMDHNLQATQTLSSSKMLWIMVFFTPDTRLEQAGSRGREEVSVASVPVCSTQKNSALDSR